MNKLSIIVPCYNEEESLPCFHLAVSKVLCHMTEIDYEIIFVDDGSEDESLMICQNWAIKDSK